MGLIENVKKVVSKAEYEKEVIKGNKEKNKIHYSRRKFKKPNEAAYAFFKAKEKLFNVNTWNNIQAPLKAGFEIYNKDGKKLKSTKVKVGDYLKINLPGPAPTSWVYVQEVFEGYDTAEFVVRPSEDPTQKDADKHIEHFFSPETTSSFRVTLKDNIVSAYEIGRNEFINNKKPTAGDRAFANTVTSIGGWMGYQKYQWKNLTDFLIGVSQ